MTKRDQIIARLIVEGCIEVQSKSAYRIFQRPDGRYWLVGKGGGLRSNDRPAASGSRGWTGTTYGDRVIAELIAKGREHQKPKAKRA